MGKFAGKVAIVTGAGGIGRVISHLFAAEGAKVVVVDLPSREAGTPSAAERAVEEIRAAGGEAIASHEVIGEWASGEKIVQSALDAFGRVDALVSAAGNLATTPLVDLTEQEWDSINNVHMKGQVSVLQAVARQLIAQGEGGSAILFSSRASFFAPTPAYAAAKAGVLGLTSAASLELAKHGINVNAILPSAQTSLFPGDAQSRPVTGGTPFVPDIDPAGIAPIVAYLASTAGAAITGRWVYAAGNDIAFYDLPLVLSNRPTLLRGSERWTLDGLEAVLPSLLGQLSN
jgi:3-oxoacyl-[acyl-carrier protein] reductase